MLRRTAGIWGGLGFAAAAIAAARLQVLWTATPMVAANATGVADWYRQLARVIAIPTLATFIGAGVTTRLDSASKGAAQRSFLTCVFAFQAATGLATTNGTLAAT